MKYQLLGFNVSFLVHGILIALVFSINQEIFTQNKKTVIDLSILESGELDTPGIEKSGTAEDPEPLESRQPKTGTEEPENTGDSREEPPSIVPPAPVPDTVKEEIKTAGAGPLAGPPIPQIEETYSEPSPEAEPVSSMPGITESGRVSEDTGRSETGVGMDSDGSGVPEENIGRPADVESSTGRGGAYLKANYAFIRDMLSRNLIYPKIARKMGWSGEVLVSFMLSTDGYVLDIKVEKSCGIALLDNSAIKTVQNACPFPASQTEVTIMIPILYQLN